MTDEQARPEPSLPPGTSELLKFQVPEVEDTEVYLVRLADGRIVARTKDELDEGE